ncbi:MULTISPECIES: tautomerase family protein [unclassified Streptomyces]|uniref:tautomerase family protein n=1 Tax=unclassified Streptomyces TaxID=2593676 RepID=UPI0022552418|nr:MULTISPECIES: tautomerase family protein [unclassified Streptomyces]MCX5328387.1 4-oxalocrotonate tautomerase family protein [Streptomyces sp. NBC_00140]MCX5357803.1 4-oxalocrotonate tautomerase family protein [Streptomyces sp. NBC_00124]
MPHLTVHLPENRLTGREPVLVAALTDAIVDVYGDWARNLVSVRLAGVPAGRFAQGGKAVDTNASVILGVRAGVFDRPDADQITARLGTALTEAITRVVGDDLRTGTMVELVASPPDRTFVGGVLTV